MKTEAQTSTKVMLDSQKMSAGKTAMEGFMILFTCSRVAELFNEGMSAGVSPSQIVNDARHILAEAIGAKECSCQMCICDVLAENTLLGNRNGGAI